MSKFSNYTENNIVQTTLRGAAFPVPAGVYVGLFTADPTDANVTANEVQTAAWPAYARRDAADGAAISTGWTASADGVSSNAKNITFAANNGAGSVTVTHIGLYDAATGGNLLYHAALTSSKTLLVGDVLSFGIGSITVTVA
jgi:hypothetical protein